MFNVRVDRSMPQVDVFQALLKMADLSRSTQDHMIQVYQALLTMAVAAAVGSLVQARFALGGLFTFVGVLGSVIWLAMNPFKPNDTAVNNKRIGLACLVAFFTGVSMGPLLSMVYQTQGDGVIALAFAGTAAMFTCFSVSAMLWNKRSIMYTASLIGSVTLAVCILGLSNLFFRTPFTGTLHLVAGVVLFSLYVIYDTQMMILQAEQGYKDVANHALQLFLDFVNLFIRILRLLSDKNKRKNNRD